MRRNILKLRTLIALARKFLSKWTEA